MPPSRQKHRRPKRAGATAGTPEAGAKQALWQSAEIYRALFKNSPVPLQSVDENARITEVNDAWLKLFGYLREEVIGRPLADFYTQESAASLQAHGWAELLEKGEIHNVERQLRGKSGAIITVLLSGSVERDSEGRFVRGYGVLIDITARRKLERERDRYFEMSRDFLAIAGFEGKIRDLNPAITEATGLSRDLIRATPFLELIYPEDRPAAEAGMQRLAAGAPVTETEVRYRYRDGTWHWSAWKSSAIPEEGVIFSVGRDIHEQRQAEELLRRSERLEAIGQLTGGIAHDFNNLLTIVVGNLDRIITHGSADERIKRLAGAALEGAERGARLAEHLLAFARRQRLEPQVLHLDEMLPRMEALYRRAVGEAIELSFTWPVGLWPCLADPGRLETAVLNLILNARDAMPSGGRLTVSAANLSVAAQDVPDLAPSDYLVITVSDTGTGMSPVVLARAFEPFFSTKPVGQGSGLGLSMVYGFAQQSGGTTRIESTPGLGTKVYLYLPRATEKPADAVRDVPPVEMAKRSASILVVEDEPGVRQVTADILEDLGHRVMVAGNGPEALEVLEREPALDLLITDIVMPGGISGTALASQARQLRPQLRVLLVTGYRFGGDAEATAFEVLSKPYRPGQLAAKVQEILGRQAQ